MLPENEALPVREVQVCPVRRLDGFLDRSEPKDLAVKMHALMGSESVMPLAARERAIALFTCLLKDNSATPWSQ